MTTWYERVIAAHRAVTDAVSHAVRLKSDRSFVWQEDGSHDLPGDNGHGETAVTGTTDLFTKSEFDPWVEQLGESFSVHGISWTLNSVQYEADTGFIHYEWVWEVS